MAESTESLPLVPLRDMVVFPHQMAPFVVGRDSSIRALELALATPEKRIFLSAQKNPKIDEPQATDIHETGVIAQILQSQKLPNGHIKVMVEGGRRGVIRSFIYRKDSFLVEVSVLPVKTSVSDDLRDYMGKVLTTFEQYARLSHHLAFDGIAATLKIDDPDRFADTLAAHLNVTTPEKQELLELAKPSERLAKLSDLLEAEIEKINLERRINNKVKKQMEKAQREYYLNEKIKAIHQELGRSEDRTDENGELKKKIEEAEMPKEVAEKAMAELKRLEAMPGVSAEATVSRNYIDWLISVPWKKYAKESGHRPRREILNDDHYGLEKLKGTHP
jgi:ATP-dependent Lon protease